MRTLLAGILSTAMLLSATVATANSSTDDLVNWTETWIGLDGDFIITEFNFDENSEFDLVDLDPTTGEVDGPVLSSDIVFGIGGSVVGAILNITIPNFYDPLPTKEIHIAFNGGNGGASGFELPTVIEIVGSDTPFGVAGPSYPVFGQFVDGTTSSELVVENWALFPNPDWETISVFIPTAFEFTSLHITTQSVPEPGTLAMVGAGMLGLMVVGRRRN